MRFYSIIIPVYNRPGEIEELLETLTQQTYTNFEVIVVEDGSKKKCDHVMEKYSHQLKIAYYFKENSGQGFARNYGYQRANGDFFIVFDSDCLVPAHYLETVDASIEKEKWDAYGGPDRAHKSFTAVQKAISYAMTSVFTTGGIRGNKKHIGKYHPRSFNMGISREVFQKTSGYVIPFMGEDIEFSIRIIDMGFKTGLIEEAYVYHKRRTSILQFYQQLYFFGRARVNISRFYSSEVKVVHIIPLLFVLALFVYLLLPIVNLFLFKISSVLLIGFCLLILIDASSKNQSFKIGVLSVITAFIQLFAYGAGFLSEWVKKILGKREPDLVREDYDYKEARSQHKKR